MAIGIGAAYILGLGYLLLSQTGFDLANKNTCESPSLVLAHYLNTPFSSVHSPCHLKT
jgi:hypothetical protein